MKKLAILAVLTAIVSSCVGIRSVKTNNDKQIRQMKELIHKYETMDSCARIIMFNNDVYDIDGSDVMSDYLNVTCQIDSIRDKRK